MRLQRQAALWLILIPALLMCGNKARAAQASARSSSNAPATATPERTRYRISLNLDFDGHSYTGSERVRWINRHDRSTSVLYFHLYPNLRADIENARDSAAAATSGGADAASADEPRLEIAEVRVADSGPVLQFTLEERETVLRVQLREAVAAGASVEIQISFKGRFPEIDPDETSLPAHVVQQVGAALRDSRETRRARDINFQSRGVTLLGAFHPVLAVRNGDDWQQKIEPSIGDVVHTEVADYDVTINAPGDIALFTSGEEGFDAEFGRHRQRQFTGSALRSFAIVAGRSLHAIERAVGGVRVRAVYTPEHEKTARRVLATAADAVRIYQTRFGALPFKTVTVTEAPLVAGFGSTEFAGLSVIASAFYVDFDSPAMRNLPELVREQRQSVEDSLDFTVAHTVAHQWWGASVGSDPQRAPVLDEALAHWSALLYYRDLHGEERAQLALEDQLRGVYQIYRTFGGEDMSAERAARDYRNSFQYAAIVAAKGALMFVALRQLLGEQRFFKALRDYYEANQLEIVEPDDLRGTFLGSAELQQRRMVSRLFNRWLSDKRGDEDIAPPNPQLADAIGISVEPAAANKDRNALSRLGRFFWRQMTRIR